MDLRDYLYHNRISVKEFADSIGYSRSYISLLVNDKNFPSLRLAKDIEKATNGQVKTSSWKNLKKKTKLEKDNL